MRIFVVTHGGKKLQVRQWIVDEFLAHKDEEKIKKFLEVNGVNLKFTPPLSLDQQTWIPYSSVRKVIILK